MKEVRDMKSVRNPLENGGGGMEATREEVESGYQVPPDTDRTRETPRWEWKSGFLGRANGYDR